jgi:seryl-tRNA synthetase
LIQASIKEIYKGRAISPKYQRLNLGQFKTTNCGDSSSTASQRSIVVVAADIDTSTGNDDVTIPEALKDFLKKLEEKEGAVGSFKLGDYSLFNYTS